jgi:hypothetical protein
MSSLSSVYFKKDTLKTLLDVLEKKGEAGVKLTVNLSDEAKTFTRDNGDKINTNVGVYVEQTKEDRDANKPRFYVANGNCFWTDGSVVAVKGYEKAGEADQAPPVQSSFTEEGSDLDLPF